MSNVDFPRSPTEIDVKWLSSILREAGALADGKIVSVDAESTAAGFGVVSWSARLRLTYERPVSDAPQSLFVKSSAGDPAVRVRMHARS